jgi:hypothetical protein
MIRDSVKVILACGMGILVGVGRAWRTGAVRGVQVEIVEGYSTTVNQAGTGIGVATEPGGRCRGYGLAGAFWGEGDGARHTRGPTCLEPLSSGHVKAAGEAPGWEIVVWLECLD